MEARTIKAVPGTPDGVLLMQAHALFGKLPATMPGSEQDTPAMIALGKKLYFEKAISINKMNAYWRAANNLSVGQIYLCDNPLLKRPLALADVKHMLLGHWGTIHERGELGYSRSHSFGAAFDNSDLIVSCVVGDGDAETGPLATACHSNKFLNPVPE